MKSPNSLASEVSEVQKSDNKTNSILSSVKENKYIKKEYSKVKVNKVQNNDQKESIERLQTDFDVCESSARKETKNDSNFNHFYLSII